jgi:GT2 family glycosyltransferase
MIAFRVRGRVVSVLCGGLDPALADIQLNVVLDQRRSLDPGDVVSVEAGQARRRWRVQLPAELYEGRARHIGLQVKSNGRVLESAAFLFTGAPQILEPPTHSLRNKAEIGPALAAPKQTATSDDSAARSAANIEPSRDAGRGRLAGFLKEEFSADTAKRVLGYFGIIDSLEAETDPASRQERLAGLVGRMQRMSEAADDGRPIEASIIIPAFEHVEYTIAAVISLLEHAPSTRYEIIIGNNVSSDETADVFTAVGGVLRCITHQANEGFIRNCNLSARNAFGEYIVLLNNDTLILDGWLDELLAPFRRFVGIGLTGSKLLMPDGSLQEAGGIVWQDASAWNFGRGQDPTLPEFNYVKDVDYVSGAAIAVPKNFWDEIGGFDERYVPAYFDDSDLAFTLRAKGLRTLYAPGSQLIHHEGITHGTDVTTSTKAYQAANRDKFVAKWQSALAAGQYPNAEHVFLARDRSRHRKHILVIDHYIPQPDRDAGSRTMFSYVKMFVDAGLQVAFWPDNLYRDRAYIRALQDIGVEVLYGRTLVGNFAGWLKQRAPYLDYIFLSRAHVAERLIADLDTYCSAKLLYYGHDLTYERLQREYRLTGLAQTLAEIEEWREREHEIWQKSDVIYYPDQGEVDEVKRVVPEKAARVLIPYMYSQRELASVRQRISAASGKSRPSRGRSDEPSVLFVGGFQHRPNVDGARWLVHQVLPLLKRLVPGISTVLAGSKPPPAVADLAAEDVIVTGYISDPVLEWFYRSVQVVVAPLRFGAGVKGKIVEALRFGVPVVTTTPGIQGLSGATNWLEIADTPEAFAGAVARLVNDPELRRQRALRGLEYIEREFGYAAAIRNMSADIPELAELVEGKGLLCDR